MNFYQIWFRGSSRERNKLWQILSQSAQGVWFYWGSKFAFSHWLGRSPLTQCWCYRATCDTSCCFYVWIQPAIHRAVVTCEYSLTDHLQSAATHIQRYLNGDSAPVVCGCTYADLRALIARVNNLNSFHLDQLDDSGLTPLMPQSLSHSRLTQCSLLSKAQHVMSLCSECCYL